MRFSIATLACLIVGLVSGAFAGCGYDDRDYSGVVFACDAQHPCPNGGPCTNGKCKPVDPDDGGGSAQQGVACGSSVCPLGMSCCSEFGSGPLRCAAAGCSGTDDFELQCDGKEDCSGGRSCCLAGVDTVCGTNCPGTTVCSTSADCTGSERFCCDLGAFPFPLKLCQPASC